MQFPHKIEKRADFDSFFVYNTRKEAVVGSFFLLEDKEFFSTISRKESHGWLIVPCNREKEAMFFFPYKIGKRPGGVLPYTGHIGMCRCL